MRGKILKNAFRLKNNLEFSKVGIGKDLTIKQREVNRELRKELTNKRKDDPSKNWGIRPGFHASLSALRIRVPCPRSVYGHGVSFPCTRLLLKPFRVKSSFQTWWYLD
ncbi:hypothetical protein DPMN_037720 [Dreissena polymorpha]|uniref:Uncharacterized protein n=1 Tax=Dreissena polymorpha TaxID=45954 RepID=A0A9D4MBV3_DREPO|nr:hypothetical protein DPMN_037720 [Dreissena polymorpha]